MVTIPLGKLLAQKEVYDKGWPGGPDTMPPRVYRAYRNLLAEIRKAAERAQGTLPGLDTQPAEVDGQLVMF